MVRSEQPPDGWLDRSQSYRLRRTEEPTHIFEVGVDGSRLRQLTTGEWSDLDPDLCSERRYRLRVRAVWHVPAVQRIRQR